MHNIQEKIKPTLNKILSILLLLGIAFSVITVVNAVAPNPGHNFTESSGGVVQGDLLFGSAADVLSALAKNITATRYLSNTGATNNPAWAQVDLTNGVTGVLPVANGGVPTMTTVITEPKGALSTGAIAAVTNASLTVRKVALFNVPYTMTVNQLTYNIGAVTTAGTYKVCVYSEDGATKLIDVTSLTNVVNVNNVAVAAVALNPGNYYIAMGCATTCSNTITMFTTTAAAWINGASVPAGKKIYEGTVTHTSGICNAALGTITGAASQAPVMRLDN